MGKYVSRVGRYTATMGDWVWNYLEDSQPIKYYEQFKFHVSVKDISTGKEYDYSVPVLDNFITVEKEGEHYSWKEIDRNNLYVWLYNQVSKKEKLFVKVRLNTNFGSYPTKYKDYYLQSAIRESVILGEEDTENIIEIKQIEDLDWLFNKGLNIEWIIK